MTTFLRKISSGTVNAAASWLDRIGIQPNWLTILGSLGHLAAAWLMGMGKPIPAALVLIFFGLFDTLDGALARYQDNVTSFGAFLDSICDRFSEAAIFLGIFYYYLTSNLFIGSVLAFLAFISSVLVSYTRARAESIGVVPKLGLMTRVERYITLVLALLLDRMILGLAVTSILGFFTVGQRIWFVHRQLKSKD